ncbi:MAG TPA: hypothetical protein DEP23_12625 [Ruminococcaceae bacterium]|nr:hypothetical protein [Oscillospiraceae bacterium]
MRIKNHLWILLILLICTLGITGCSNTIQQNISSNTAAQDEIESDNSSSQEADAATATGQETEGSDNMSQVISGSFAIHNVETGKNLRPYKAGTSDGNDIILYPHHEWKCLTWQFNHVEGATYQLQNLYTDKTFEPVATPEAGVALWQQPLDDDSPMWEFTEEQVGVFTIKLKDTDLVVTISSDKTDAAIVLMPYENSSSQQWELIEQYPRH